MLAPADGRIVEVIDNNADTPAGINGDQANLVMLDIGDGRFVVLVHLQQGSATVRVGDEVRSGDPLAAVGNSGHTNEPHLHMQVQASRAISDADRTYPIAFRNVQITRGGPWPWSDERILRTGDTVRGPSPQLTRPARAHADLYDVDGEQHTCNARARLADVVFLGGMGFTTAPGTRSEPTSVRTCAPVPGTTRARPVTGTPMMTAERAAASLAGRSEPPASRCRWSSSATASAG